MRNDQPNASHFSARYAEQKMAQRRSRLALPPKAMPCSRPGCGVLILQDHLCPACRAENERRRDAGDYAGAEAFLAGRP